MGRQFTWPHDASRATGSVRHTLPQEVEAGSWQEFLLTYTAGYFGVDDTGSIKICWRYAADIGTPQFDDPAAAHYVSARASNGAALALRYDPKDNVRPWGRTVQVKVLNGFLREGDRLEVCFGRPLGWRPRHPHADLLRVDLRAEGSGRPDRHLSFPAGGGGEHGRHRARSAGALVRAAADGGNAGRAVPPAGEGGGSLGQRHGRGTGPIPPAAEPSGARAARHGPDRRRAARHLPRWSSGRRGGRSHDRLRPGALRGRRSIPHQHHGGQAEPAPAPLLG